MLLFNQVIIGYALVIDRDAAPVINTPEECTAHAL